MIIYIHQTDKNPTYMVGCKFTDLNDAIGFSERLKEFLGEEWTPAE